MSDFDPKAFLAAPMGPPAPNTEDPDFDPTAFLSQGLPKPISTWPGAKPLEPMHAPIPTANLGERARDTLFGIGRTIKGGAKAVGEVASDVTNVPGNIEAASHDPRGFWHAIASGDYGESPARRRQLERGIDDMVTLGHGAKLAARIGNSRLFGLRAAGDSPETAIGPETFGQLQPGMAFRPQGPSVPNTQVADQEKAPEFRQAGNLLGLMMPGATDAILEGGAGLASRGMELLPRPASALGRIAYNTGRSVAGYEAAAPAMAALSADAEGHRLKAALEAATNPVGLGLSALAGNLHGHAEDVNDTNEIRERLGLEPEDIRARIIKGARERATKDMARDIISAEGPKARATDQARIRDVSDRLFNLTQEKPELREIWRQSASKAIPQLAEEQDRIAIPLDNTYTKVDRLTGGGIRLGDILDGFDDAAKESASTAAGQPQAARIRGVRDNFVKAYAEPAFDPTVPIDGVPAGTVIQKLQATGAPASQIDAVKQAATRGIDLDKRIPTSMFREEVTNLHKTAEQAMGTIEGTAKHEALGHLYEIGKSIIDKHLDESGLPDAELKALRKANEQYFLVTRAKNAIESRGVKESNRSTGFRIPRNAHQLIESPLAPLAAAPYFAMHASPLHAAAEVAGLYGLQHVLPALRARLDWKIANLPIASDPELLGGAVERARDIPETGEEAGPELAGANLARALSATRQRQNP